MQRRLASRNPAAAISTSSAWPWSIRKPKGTGVTALPSGKPALTKPKTLPTAVRRRVL
jgi:hypothetical protein